MFKITWFYRNQLEVKLGLLNEVFNKNPTTLTHIPVLFLIFSICGAIFTLYYILNKYNFHVHMTVICVTDKNIWINYIIKDKSEVKNVISTRLYFIFKVLPCHLTTLQIIKSNGYTAENTYPITSEFKNQDYSDISKNTAVSQDTQNTGHIVYTTKPVAHVTRQSIL